METLAGQNLQALGLIPGQAERSNICLAGAWDMPARDGKTSHTWAEGNGLQPYLRADEIFFTGTDLYYTFLIDTPSRANALEKCYTFYDLLGSFDELKPFSSEFGEFEVYVKNEIRVEYFNDGLCKGLLQMRQPVVDLEGIIPAADNMHPGIDGISFEQLGFILMDVAGDFNRPATKDASYTKYGSEGYQITKQGYRTLKLSLLLDQPSYTLFSSSIQSLKALLAQPNARVFMNEGLARECFAKDGFKVTSLYQQGDGYCATIELVLTEIRVLADYTIFTDSIGNILTDGNGVPLSEIFKQQ